VIELAPGVRALGSGKGGRVRAFLLDTGNELTLVDTLFEDDGRQVLSAIDALGRKPSDVKRIVITHAHRSHLGGVAALKRATGATVLAHEWEADIIGGDRRAQPGTLTPLTPLKLIPFRLGLRFNRPKHHPCPVDETIAEGDAAGPLHVLFTPGHSPGHLAFHWPEKNFLIVGDSIATWPSFGPGWRGFNLNPRQHRASLERVAALEPSIVGVGHGDPITDAAAERVHEAAAQAAAVETAS
jgi:glyoxylase-like metal-dependent hydrolase (beta-lactamase superfamily II)